jgi:hypothetical protein
MTKSTLDLTGVIKQIVGFGVIGPGNRSRVEISPRGNGFELAIGTLIRDECILKKCQGGRIKKSRFGN